VRVTVGLFTVELVVRCPITGRPSVGRSVGRSQVRRGHQLQQLPGAINSEVIRQELTEIDRLVVSTSALPNTGR